MWFDWRMIPVMITVLFGFLAAACGALLFVIELFAGPAPGLVGTGVTPGHIFIGGIVAVALGVLAAEWCRRNPDAGT